MAGSARPGLIDVLLLVVVPVWGWTYLKAKDLVEPATVVAVLAPRFVVTVLAMALFCVQRMRRTSRHEMRRGVILGAILAIEFALETFGIAGTSDGALPAGMRWSSRTHIIPVQEHFSVH